MRQKVLPACDSLAYNGIDGHESLSHFGLYATTIAREVQRRRRLQHMIKSR